MAEVHLYYLQRPPARGGTIVGTDGTVALDLLGPSVVYHASGGREAKEFPVEMKDFDELYLAEMRHFLACVQGGETPLVGLEDGGRVLRTALMTRKSPTTGKAICDNEDK